MDREAVINHISELRRHYGELESIEAKSAHVGTPPDLYKPISAFANRPGGGILLFGLDEDAGFKVVGAGNPRKLQEDIRSIASQMEPPLCPVFSVEHLEGGTVVVVEVPEVPNDLKPCYHRPHRLQDGAFVRAGNANRHMSDYEVFCYICSRTR
jgi:ATP-dependent DNA helicase RecG